MQYLFRSTETCVVARARQLDPGRSPSIRTSHHPRQLPILQSLLTHPTTISPCPRLTVSMAMPRVYFGFLPISTLNSLRASLGHSSKLTRTPIPNMQKTPMRRPWVRVFRAVRRFSIARGADGKVDWEEREVCCRSSISPGREMRKMRRLYLRANPVVCTEARARRRG